MKDVKGNSISFDCNNLVSKNIFTGTVQRNGPKLIVTLTLELASG